MKKRFYGGKMTKQHPKHKRDVSRIPIESASYFTTPGKPTIYVRPTPGGGFTVQKPGESPIYIRKTP